MNNLYQQEQDIAFKFILNQIAFNNFHSYDINGVMNCVELIITPECNLACDYCYIHKHGDLLYPKEIRDHQTILKNLKILLQFFIDNDLKFKSLSLFSGEIWGSKFGIEVLSTIYECYKNNYPISKDVSIPSNMSFLLQDNYTSQIENIMKQFQDIGVKVHWSASVEGKILEDKFRPFKDSNLKHTDDFYDRVFKFAKKYNVGFHPMVSSKSCDLWIENYKWFVEQFKKYDLDRDDPMMLEVRDNNWTQENIDDYLKFLDYLFEVKQSIYKDKNQFAQYITQYGKFGHKGFSPLSLRVKKQGLTCAIQTSLHIRLGDLAIVPCHRTSYDKFIYGYFIVDENEKIVNIKAKNPELALYIMTVSPSLSHPGCEKCIYSAFCGKGCLGAQYEAYQDLVLPCSTVCDFSKQRIDYLIQKYHELGIFDEIEKDVDNYPEIKYILENVQKINKWKRGNYERNKKNKQ